MGRWQRKSEYILTAKKPSLIIYCEGKMIYVLCISVFKKGGGKTLKIGNKVICVNSHRKRYNSAAYSQTQRITQDSPYMLGSSLRISLFLLEWEFMVLGQVFQNRCLDHEVTENECGCNMPHFTPIKQSSGLLAPRQYSRPGPREISAALGSNCSLSAQS